MNYGKKHYTKENIDKSSQKFIIQNKMPIWQQDYFESFYDPNTGSPVTRKFESYRRRIDYDELLKTASKTGCNIRKEIHKRNTHNPLARGKMGGNVEGLPGGGCLYGNNLDSDLALDFRSKSR